MMKSAFRDWFKRQYGAVPSERKRQAARRKIRDLEHALSVAKVEFQVEDARFAAWTNALYGWSAMRAGVGQTEE
jgi:hypothetical protein